jgi:hypothetical protein
VSKALLTCHGITGTPVGYSSNLTVVFECDVCHRHVRSEITRADWLKSPPPSLPKEGGGA